MASTWLASRSEPLSKPITGSAGCCARAANGHAAVAPPMSVMNSRRLMGRTPKARDHRLSIADQARAFQQSRPAHFRFGSLATDRRALAVGAMSAFARKRRSLHRADLVGERY